MSKTYTEQNISDLIAEFNEQADVPAPAPVTTTRRTRIVEEVTTPEQGYRVVLGKYPFDVDAPTRGEAVLMALALAKVSSDPNHRNASAHVFMWTYTVTDSEGRTVRGVDMREEVQAARIAASARRNR